MSATREPRDVVAEALRAHEMVRLVGHPVKPDAYTCVCGHETRPATTEGRLKHRASEVLAALDLPALLAAARADAQDAATRAQAHSSDITAEEMAKAMHAGTNSVPWTSLTDGSWQQYRRLAEAALDYINARREEL